jgi:hypothetical protein
MTRPDPASAPGPAQTTNVPERTYRPKALLCSVLAVLWIFPSLGGLVIFLPALRGWREADSVAGALEGTRVEQWLALLLLLLHPVFIWLAWRFRRTEIPQPVPTDPDPEKPEQET